MKTVNRKVELKQLPFNRNSMVIPILIFTQFFYQVCCHLTNTNDRLNFFQFWEADKK